MPELHLPPVQTDCVRRSLWAPLRFGKKVRVFGSRATGRGLKPHSDLDLLIHRPRELSFRAMANVREALAEPDLPSSVDRSGRILRSQVHTMKILDFDDTDALLVELKPCSVAERRDLDENTVLDLDAQGRVLIIALGRVNVRAEFSSSSLDRVSAYSECRVRPLTVSSSLPPMRLGAAQTHLIVRCERQQFGADARDMLFGSGLDDTARDGGADQLVEIEAPVTLRQRVLVTIALDTALELPVDFVAPTQSARQGVRAIHRPRQRAAAGELCMATNSLTPKREHLAKLLEAAKRYMHFSYASTIKVNWPLDGNVLKQRQNDEALFEALAAFNERFAKLQDTLGVAMRHCAMLMSEATPHRVSS